VAVAKKRLEALEIISSFIKSSSQLSLKSEIEIDNASFSLPNDYTYTHSKRVKEAHQRRTARDDLDRAIKTENEPAIRDQWQLLERLKAQSLISPPNQNRAKLAVERLKGWEAVQSLLK